MNTSFIRGRKKRRGRRGSVQRGVVGIPVTGVDRRRFDCVACKYKGRL